MIAVGIGVLLLAVVGGYVYGVAIANPRVERELIAEPQGERAAKVMLLTLPSGKRIPVNYLAEDGRVYAGADGRWWREFDGPGAGAEITLLVKGETLRGRARAVLDEPDYRKDVFSRLRPNALPGTGTLVEILLDPSDPGGPVAR